MMLLFAAMSAPAESAVVESFCVAAALVAAGSAIAVRVARAVAIRRRLFDLPNDRSSHRLPTPRLGGLAFVPIWLAAAAGMAWQRGALTILLLVFLGGALGLYFVSLIDDLKSVPTRWRFTVHFAIAIALIVAAERAWPGLLGSTAVDRSVMTVGLVLWIVGLINAYNFMDGIDGIAGAQAVIAGGGWAWIGFAAGAPLAAMLAGSAAAAALGFLTLNWPPAKIFMGDAGSTVFGLTFAAMPLLLVVEERAAHELPRTLALGILLVWPFVADASFTFLRRLKNRENVFCAHRSHLYQRLVVAGRSHTEITLLYAGLALSGTVIAVGVRSASWPALTLAMIVPLGVFFALWCWTLRCERHVPLD